MNTYMIPEVALPWRRWFAWRPVVDRQTGEMLWLRRIWRRKVYFLGVRLTDYQLNVDSTEHQVENTT